MTLHRPAESQQGWDLTHSVNSVLSVNGILTNLIRTHRVNTKSKPMLPASRTHPRCSNVATCRHRSSQRFHLCSSGRGTECLRRWFCTCSRWRWSDHEPSGGRGAMGCKHPLFLDEHKPWFAQTPVESVGLSWHFLKVFYLWIWPKLKTERQGEMKSGLSGNRQLKPICHNEMP